MLAFLHSRTRRRPGGRLWVQHPSLCSAVAPHERGGEGPRDPAVGVGQSQCWGGAAAQPCSQAVPLQASPTPAPLRRPCQGPTAACSGRGPQPRMGPLWPVLSRSQGAVGPPPASSWADRAPSWLWTRPQVGSSSPEGEPGSLGGSA